LLAKPLPAHRLGQSADAWRFVMDALPAGTGVAGASSLSV